MGRSVNSFNRNMMSIRFILFSILVCFNINTCIARDQRYNPTSDFLLHEAGGAAPLYNNKNNFDTNFPSLPSLKSTQSTITSSTKPQSSGKRDYVAPQPVTTKPTSTTKPVVNGFTQAGTNSNAPKRDYVAPQFPTLKPIGTTQKQFNIITSPTPSTPPKRDYVASQFPTLKPIGSTQKQSSSIITPLPPTSPKRDYVAPKLPSANHDNTQPMTGKVKDLINFYDKNTQGGSVPSNNPSYSNILQGSKNNQKPTQSTTNIQHGIQSSTVNTPKPMSFSSIVSGSNKPSFINTPATPKSPGVSTSNLPTNRPTPSLPSSLANSQSTNTNGVSDADLQTVSEELLRKDVNNAAKYVTINYQEKTTSFSKDDKAPLPLLTISPDVWNIPTVQYFTPLLDNYERDTLVNEYVTSQERNEENAFMDAIMATSVIRHLMNFLKDKGYVSPDPKQQRDYLKQMWFGMYSRGKGKISSSGFEHIFVSELKNGEVSGLHNWLYYAKEEVANRINYLGYLKYAEFNGKGAVLKLHFNQQGIDKPVDTMFVGTSPELEVAIYTLCYVTRVDKDCNLKLGSKDVNIVTHNFRYRSKNYIGSAYPQI